VSEWVSSGCAYSVSWGWELPPRTTMLRTMAEVGLPGAGERAGSKGMREDAAQAVQAVRAVQTV
jgi:hypothetical protein